MLKYLFVGSVISMLGLSDKHTPDEYLALELKSEVKHEFVNGEILAMAGASLRHNRLLGNLSGTLFGALRGTSCYPYGSDLRLYVNETGLFAYPDLTMVCGQPQLVSDIKPDTITNTTALIEVLSESTESWDRGAKASHYRRIESLKEYIFVSQAEVRIEHHVRQADGRWLLHAELIGEDAPELGFTAVPASISVRDIYQGVLDSIEAAD